MITKIFRLSEKGRRLTYKRWIHMGGCGLPNCTHAYEILGARAHWNENTTLKQIEDACPFTGRVFARFAIDILKKPEYTKAYDDK